MTGAGRQFHGHIFFEIQRSIFRGVNHSPG